MRFLEGVSKKIQIRNVPDHIHRGLRVRAAGVGMSRTDFLTAGPTRPGPTSSEPAHPTPRGDLVTAATVLAYDAGYPALATVLDAPPLATTDRKLANPSRLPCSVEVV